MRQFVEKKKCLSASLSKKNTVCRYVAQGAELEGGGALKSLPHRVVENLETQQGAS